MIEMLLLFKNGDIQYFALQFQLNHVEQNGSYCVYKECLTNSEHGSLVKE